MSEASFFRRDPQGPRSDFWHTVRVGLVMMVLAIATLELPTMAFRWLYIDLQSVSIPDHEPGDDPDVTVFRKIRSDFWGGYVVTIRQAGSHRFVCSIPVDSWFEYRKQANATQPLILPISDWLGDDADLTECEDMGFQNGYFYAVTCHLTNAFGFIPARRCVNSNVFLRGNQEPL